MVPFAVRYLKERSQRDALMTTIVLFHSALGLTPSVTAFAQALRDDGHIVETPDLFEGAVFTSLADGVQKRDDIGIPTLSERAMRSIAPEASNVVFAGFSMGAASAQLLAATHSGAVGCVLMHAALPLEAFGLTDWPVSVPIQFHSSRNDPWVDQDTVARLQERISSFYPCWYDGAAHLFAERDGGEYVSEHAEAMLSRVRRLMSSE